MSANALGSISRRPRVGQSIQPPINRQDHFIIRFLTWVSLHSHAVKDNTNARDKMITGVLTTIVDMTKNFSPPPSGLPYVR
jgi:hypothetical protein